MTISAFDVAAFETIHVNAVLSPGTEAVAEFIAVWGIAVVPACLAILWFLGNRSSRLTCIVAGLAATLSLTVAGLLSWTFYAPRPFSEGLARNVLHHVADSSFPSDHLSVLSAVLFATLLGRRFGTSAILGVSALAVAWSRIALGIHFPSDVVGALVIGGMAATLFKTRRMARFVHFVWHVVEAVVDPARCARLTAWFQGAGSRGHPRRSFASRPASR